MYEGFADRSAGAKDTFVAGMASHGLGLFYQTLNTTDRGQLTVLLEKSLRLPSMLPLLQVTDLIAQEEGRSNSPSHHDLRERNEEVMRFVGDNPEDGKPSLAWVMIWKGRFSNLFGEAIPDHIKLWGYVFWDVHRMIESDAKLLLEIQWYTAWPRDPRRLFR